MFNRHFEIVAGPRSGDPAPLTVVAPPEPTPASDTPRNSLEGADQSLFRNRCMNEKLFVNHNR